jgi:hypothetical protein
VNSVTVKKVRICDLYAENAVSRSKRSEEVMKEGWKEVMNEVSKEGRKYENEQESK